MKWSFALLIVSATALDAFWVLPVERDMRERARSLEPFLRKCPGRAAAARPRRAPLAEHELRVIDVKLLSPRHVRH